MVITKEVETVVTINNYKYYQEKGYDIQPQSNSKHKIPFIPRNTKICVKLEDLIDNSISKIDVKCDCCDQIYSRSYKIHKEQENRIHMNLCPDCSKHYTKWHYDIGQRIIKDNLDITIINRKLQGKDQYYMISCNKCGFDGKQHIRIKNNPNKEYKDEYWIALGNLIKINSCPCCGGAKSIIVKGINDIATTDPWMTEWLPPYVDPAKYISTSGEKIDFKCKGCGEIRKNIVINYMHSMGYLACGCRNTGSIPNRIAYFVFQELKDQLDYYEKEYSPKWAGMRAYDNYFIKNNKQYIVEMDGSFHTSDNKMSGQTKEESKNIDRYKDQLAQKHGIEIIRVKCPDGDFHNTTYDNLLQCLSNIFNVSHINKSIIMEQVHKNFIKIICDYYNEHPNTTMTNIANNFNIHIHTLRDYLLFGNKYGWCDYYNKNTVKNKYIEQINIIIQEHPNITQKEISEIMGIHPRTVSKYMKDKVLKNEEELELRRKKAYNKTVYMYDLNYNLVKIYRSTSEAERLSEQDFGFTLRSRAISRVCLGERKTYKGFIFSYVELNKNINE